MLFYTSSCVIFLNCLKYSCIIIRKENNYGKSKNDKGSEWLLSG
jgi:hypothetical protein